MSNEPIPLQYLLEGIKAKKFVDSSFMGDLDKIFKNVGVVNISIYVEDDEGIRDIISIGYPHPEYEKKDQLIVDTSMPGTLNKIIEIIKKD